MAIEEIEKPAAQERQRAAGRSFGNGIDSFGSRDPKLSDKQELRPRDIAAEAIGMGEATYRRIKTVKTLADDETAPEEIRHIAQDSLNMIDKGASVRAEYNRVTEARRAIESTDSAAADKQDGRSDRSNAVNGTHEYLRGLAETYPTLRLAFDNDGNSRYASLGSFDAAARAAGATWRFTERQWQANVTTSADILNRSSMSIDVALDAIAERLEQPAPLCVPLSQVRDPDLHTTKTRHALQPLNSADLSTMPTTLWETRSSAASSVTDTLRPAGAEN